LNLSGKNFPKGSLEIGKLSIKLGGPQPANEISTLFEKLTFLLNQDRVNTRVFELPPKLCPSVNLLTSLVVFPRYLIKYPISIPLRNKIFHK
jgi:hypothetical protein